MHTRCVPTAALLLTALASLTGCQGDQRAKEEAQAKNLEQQKQQEERDRASREEAAKIRAEAAALPIACHEGGERFSKARAAVEAGNGRAAMEVFEPCGAFFSDAKVKALYQKADKLAKTEEGHSRAREAAAAMRQAAMERAERKRQGVRVGMTAEDVIASSWGRPQSVNRTTTASGVHEQWVYGGQNYLYFENGVLTAIQN